jgi:hypothetical protein
MNNGRNYNLKSRALKRSQIKTREFLEQNPKGEKLSDVLKLKMAVSASPDKHTLTTNRNRCHSRCEVNGND